MRRALSSWYQAARNHEEMARRSRMLPVWPAIAFVVFDFLLLGFWYRHSHESSLARWIVGGVEQFCIRLALVIITLVLACKHYRVSREAIGIRPSEMLADLRWSVRLCLLGLSVIAVGIIAA